MACTKGTKHVSANAKHPAEEARDWDKRRAAYEETPSVFVSVHAHRANGFEMRIRWDHELGTVLGTKRIDRLEDVAERLPSLIGEAARHWPELARVPLEGWKRVTPPARDTLGTELAALRQEDPSVYEVWSW
jgi:hypothetical protein